MTASFSPHPYDNSTELFPRFQVAAFFLAFKGIEGVESAIKDGKAINAGDLFGSSIFRNIVLSLLATLGLYIVSSILFVSGSPLS